MGGSTTWPAPLPTVPPKQYQRRCLTPMHGHHTRVPAPSLSAQPLSPAQHSRSLPSAAQQLFRLPCSSFSHCSAAALFLVQRSSWSDRSTAALPTAAVPIWCPCPHPHLGNAEAGHDLVEAQQGAVGLGDLTQTLEVEGGEKWGSSRSALWEMGARGVRRREVGQAGRCKAHEAMACRCG